MDYRRHFSYVKDIYIELKDYTFFHSPSQGETAQSRFVGRQKLKDRLSEILSKAGTRSGAYLVTGYRGVGKSSLVNQVLDELSINSMASVWRKVSRPILYTLLICLFLKSEYLKWIFRPYGDTLFQWDNPVTKVHFTLLAALLLVLKFFSHIPVRRSGSSRALIYIVFVSAVALGEFLWKGISNVTFYYTSMTLYASAWIWLAETSPNKNDLRLKYTSNIGRFLVNFLNTFRMDMHRFPKETHYHLLQGLFFVASPLVFLGPVFLSGEVIEKYTAGEAAFVLLLALGLFVAGVKILQVIVSKVFLRSNGWSPWPQGLHVVLRNLMNYSRRINIRINLGHEELKEAEVLRLIAKKFYSEYRAVRNVFWGVPFNLVNMFLRFALIFLILNTISTLPRVKRASDKFKNETNFVYYFPSQNFSDVPTPRPIKPSYIDISTRYVDTVIYNVLLATAASTSISRDQFDLAEGTVSYWLAHKIMPAKISLPQRGPDYLFIIEFIVCWFLVGFVISRRPFNIMTHQSILKRFQELNDRLDATVEMEGSQSIGGHRKWFTISNRHKRTFGIAGPREIEAELISILEDIDKIPRLWNRPEFIVVLDELDKIRRHENNTILDKESENPGEGMEVDEAASRTHKESVIRLLANLKHFFTTAKAKFIFIAGREMFDASLADISDRNYFMGSIFHDVIYVNSLLTDVPQPTPESAYSRKHRSYYTALIEEYVCQFLIPASWNSGKSRSLKTYKEYLYDFHSVNEIKSLTSATNKLTVNVSKLDRLTMLCLNRRMRDIISFKNLGWSCAFDHMMLLTFSAILQSKLNNVFRPLVDDHMDFLVNFSPLKPHVRRLVEEEKAKADNADYALFHLRNFITYVTYRSGGAPKKLSYLLEQHIVPIDKKNRAHNQLEGYEVRDNPLSVIIGHSTNNLYLHFDYYEIYTFGVINYLTTPFLHSISRYLKKYDDKLTVSSTYLLDHLYKFHNSGFSWRNLEVTPEIVDVNKAPSLRQLIHDIVHFLSKIHLENVVSGLYDFRFDQRLSQEIAILSKFNPKEQAAFNFTLDESQEIKRYYNRKLKQLIKGYNVKPGNESDFIHSIGFLHGSLGDLHYYDQEYDDALVQYKDAVEFLRNGGLSKTEENLDASQFLFIIRIMLRIGLTYEKKKAFASALLTYEDLSLHVMTYLKAVPPHKKPQITKPVTEKPGIEKNSLTGEIILDYGKQRMTSIVSSLRLLYQPFLAKLYLKEKEKIGGVKKTDLDLADKELKAVFDRIGESDRDLIKSEFSNKIGDILFFKNETDSHKDVSLAIDKYLTALDEILKTMDHPQATMTVKDEETAVLRTLNVMRRIIRGEATVSSVSLKMLANDLTDLADTLLTQADDKPAVSTILEKLKYHESIVDIHNHLLTGLNKLDYSIAIFLLASAVYRHTHDFKKSALQHTKILHILEQTLEKEDIDQNQLDLIEKIIVKPALRDFYHAFNPSSRPEIERIKNIFKDDSLTNSLALQYLPVYAEIQEVIALFLMIEVGSPLYGKKELLRDFEKFSQFCNHSVPSMYSRIAVMNFKLRYNRKLYDELLKEKKPSREEMSQEEKDLQNFLVTDSIFCATSILRILTSMGLSYITNHSFHASAYEIREFWCREYQKFAREDPEGSGRESAKLIKKLLGSEILDALQPEYNREKSLIHYLHAVETHTGQTAFMNMIDKMHYLDDDFDDEYYHFHAALERNRLPRIRRKIHNLKDSLETEVLYDYNIYLS